MLKSPGGLLKSAGGWLTKNSGADQQIHATTKIAGMGEIIIGWPLALFHFSKSAGLNQKRFVA